MSPPYLIVHQSLSCLYLNWMIPYAFKTFSILSSQKPILAQRCHFPRVCNKSLLISIIRLFIIVTRIGLHKSN